MRGPRAGPSESGGPRLRTRRRRPRRPESRVGRSGRAEPGEGEPLGRLGGPEARGPRPAGAGRRQGPRRMRQSVLPARRAQLPRQARVPQAPQPRALRLRSHGHHPQASTRRRQGFEGDPKSEPRLTGGLLQAARAAGRAPVVWLPRGERPRGRPEGGSGGALAWPALGLACRAAECQVASQRHYLAQPRPRPQHRGERGRLARCHQRRRPPIGRARRAPQRRGSRDQEPARRPRGGRDRRERAGAQESAQDGGVRRRAVRGAERRQRRRIRGRRRQQRRRPRECCPCPWEGEREPGIWGGDGSRRSRNLSMRWRLRGGDTLAATTSLTTENLCYNLSFARERRDGNPTEGICRGR